MTIVGEAIEKKEVENEGIVNSLEANEQLEAKADVDPQSTVEPNMLCQPGEGETNENIADFICQSMKNGQAQESDVNPASGGRSWDPTTSTSSPQDFPPSPSPDWCPCAPPGH